MSDEMSETGTKWGARSNDIYADDVRIGWAFDETNADRLVKAHNAAVATGLAMEAELRWVLGIFGELCRDIEATLAKKEKP